MVAAASARELEPLRSREDLLAPFHEAEKPRERFRVGAECEKVGVFEKSLGPLAYRGDRGVERILRRLSAAHGWAVAQDDPLIALEKDHASVTLEPGAQLELSGAPLPDMHRIDEEFTRHHAELAAINEELRAELGEGIAWLGIGFHPLAAQADLDWVPKARYGVMREYLPTRGEYGLDMMRRTATVQANFDYTDEAFAMRALRVGLKLSPFFVASLANAPFVEGAPWGGKSFRAQVWTSVDPDRQGLIPGVLDGVRGYDDYVDWALDAPMFLVLRGHEIVRNTGQTFRAFWADGFAGHRATYGDWVTHLNTMFPEVRLKRTLEVRGGDSLPRDLLVAPSALWTGLFYDDRALAEAEELVRDFGTAELVALRGEVGRTALETPFRGKPAAAVAERMVDIARGGLVRRGRRRADGQDESVYLEPLAALVGAARCPADDLLEAYGRTGSVAIAAFERCRL